jgi:hypothetical protein
MTAYLENDVVDYCGAVKHNALTLKGARADVCVGKISKFKPHFRWQLLEVISKYEGCSIRRNRTFFFLM